MTYHVSGSAVYISDYIEYHARFHAPSISCYGHFLSYEIKSIEEDTGGCDMKSFHEVRKYRTDVKIWHREFRSINFIAHWHSEIELIYILSGEAQIHAAGTTFVAKMGDLIICDSNDIHYYDGRKDDCRMDFLIFDPAEITNHYKIKGFVNPYLRREEMEKNGLDLEWTRMAEIIDSELTECGPYFREISRAAVSSFWYRLLRVMPVNPPQKGNAGNENISMRTTSQEILSFLEDHYSEQITLEEASDHAGFSPSYFSKYFKRLTGTNFNQYLNLLRIAHATDMISRTGDTFTNIAFSCGFNNIRTFNRVFRKYTGVSPSEYLTSPHSGLIG